MKKIKFVLVLAILAIAISKFGVSRLTYVRAEDSVLTHQQEVYIHAIEFCESHGKENIKIMDSNNRYSYGVLMFQVETFLREGKKYGIIDEDTTSKQGEKLIYNVDLQEKIAHQMLLNGGERNWYNCWKQKLKTKYPQ